MGSVLLGVSSSGLFVLSHGRVSQAAPGVMLMCHSWKEASLACVGIDAVHHI